ncbi:Ig-like domain-containing protein [Sodalis ligni]|uniref:Ig-like domain-containing protein n=1 Tax=Sodalis ligni TaxID=2697027 RepID=UPI00193F549D|nr:Ig-like domain-containing protein [Sodalis ligni]QWA09538.1 Ig-like domain-containing protein [Sodalis ligni]
MNKFLAGLKRLFNDSKDKPMPQLILAVLLNGQVADGVAANSVQVNVAGSGGTPVAGVAVNFGVNAGTVTPASAQTDANGQITVNITNTAAGPITFTATLADGTASQSVNLEFVAVPEVPKRVVEVGNTTIVGTIDAAAINGTKAPAAPALSPLEKARADFEAFAAFVEHGVSVLGANAEATLVALKDKFL